MLMSPELARDTLAELIQDCALPIRPDVLLKTKWIHNHGHIVIGGNAIRAFKDKARWRYDERDIRRAGHQLVSVTVDPQDLVEVQILRRERRADYSQPPDEADWRRGLAWQIHHAAFLRSYRAGDGIPSDDVINEHGLPGQITLDNVINHYANTSIGGLQPLRALTRTGPASWSLPRACTTLLDCSQALEQTLLEQAQICSSCKSQGPRYGGWRQPTTTGYVTLCPPCSGAAYQPYKGHLRGVAYRDLRRTMRADDYLCRLCQASRAFTWDHCHDHGHIRGPVCASCNTFEGKGVRFLQGEGSILHLLECRGCRDWQTLPQRYRLDIASEHLHNTERHGRCRSRPHVWDHDLHHGIHNFTLSCPSHYTRWTSKLTTAQIHELTRAVVTAALAGKTEKEASP
ncbi:endonuclease domain-containing protein [Streptomyces xanthophaeus]